MKRYQIISTGILICFLLAAWITVRIISRRIQPQPLPLPQADTSEALRDELARRGHTELSPIESEHLLAGECETMHKPDQFPEAIKRAFATLTDERPFSLAAPGERFNETDVLEPGLPTRRLILGGRCGDRWFIEYEHGGLARSIGLVVFKIDADQSVAVLWGRAFKKPAPEIDQLRSALKAHGYWDSPYYW
jgi:hypothetical protein